MASRDLTRVDLTCRELEHLYGGHVLTWANVSEQGVVVLTYGASWQDPDQDARPLIEVDERRTPEAAVADLTAELAAMRTLPA